MDRTEATDSTHGSNSKENSWGQRVIKWAVEAKDHMHGCMKYFKVNVYC